MDPRRLVRRRRRAEHERLAALGVRFTQDPTEMGPVTTAVLDDTCGNLIQIASMAGLGQPCEQASRTPRGPIPGGA